MTLLSKLFSSRELIIRGSGNILKRALATSSALGNDKYIIRSACPDVEIKKEHFTDYLFKWAVENHGSKTAMVNGPTSESFTFQEARSQTDTFAAALSDLDVLQKGDVMAIMMPNNPEYVFVYGGATEIGAVVTTVNPIYTVSEVARQLKMSKTKMVTTLSNFVPLIKDALETIEGGNQVKIIIVDGKDHSADGRELSYAKLMNEARGKHFRRAEFDFNDLVCLPYSSGTTGVPKGVMLSHKNVCGNGRQAIYSKGVELIPLASDSYQPSTVCVLPMFHAFGSIITTFTTLHAAGNVITMPNFDPEEFIKNLVKHRPTLLHFAPPLVAFCATHPMVKPEHLESLDFILVGAAPVGQALISQFQKKAPHVQFREGWGMTETSPIGLLTPPGRTKPGSCGVAVANTEIKIADLQTGEALPPNERGELCLRGPQVMVGYLDNEEATRKTVKTDGWLHTGDIAHHDEEGWIFIVDRLKELIKVKGFQVPPAELEDLLRSHDAIQDVAVIGIPNEKMGEVPRAYIVKKDQNITEDMVHEYVNKEVAEYKRLRGGIEFIDAVPKSAAGKILRKDLLQEWKDKNEA